MILYNHYTRCPHCSHSVRSSKSAIRSHEKSLTCTYARKRSQLKEEGYVALSHFSFHNHNKFPSIDYERYNLKVVQDHFSWTYGGAFYYHTLYFKPSVGQLTDAFYIMDLIDYFIKKDIAENYDHSSCKFLYHKNKKAYEIEIDTLIDLIESGRLTTEHHGNIFNKISIGEMLWRTMRSPDDVVTCECGQEVKKTYLSKHKKTEKHALLMTVKDYEVLPSLDQESRRFFYSIIIRKMIEIKYVEGKVHSFERIPSYLPYLDIPYTIHDSFGIFRKPNIYMIKEDPNDLLSLVKEIDVAIGSLLENTNAFSYFEDYRDVVDTYVPDKIKELQMVGFASGAAV